MNCERTKKFCRQTGRGFLAGKGGTKVMLPANGVEEERFPRKVPQKMARSTKGRKEKGGNDLESCHNGKDANLFAFFPFVCFLFHQKKKKTKNSKTKKNLKKNRFKKMTFFFSRRVVSVGPFPSLLSWCSSSGPLRPVGPLRLPLRSGRAFSTRLFPPLLPGSAVSSFGRLYLSSQVRRAFDIGSGSIKCQVARVDLEQNVIEENLFSKSSQVLFLEKVSQQNNFISKEKQEEGLRSLQDLLSSCPGEIHNTRAIATEIFRKSQNGSEVIDYFEKQTGLQISILPPHEEALLGFRSANALTTHPKKGLISWDCGAGSFQFSSDSETHSDSLGSGTALKEALSFSKQDKTPNPFTPNSLHQLLKRLSNILKPIPAWVNSPTSNIVAIGSSQSIFNQQTFLSGQNVITIPKIKDILSRLMNLTDKEIFLLEKEMYEQHSTSSYILKEENAPYVIPKLALLLAVMESASIEQLEFFLTNGHCAAILTSPDLWSANQNRSFSSSATSTISSCVSPDQTQKRPLFQQTEQLPTLLTVNWHVQKTCNYKCIFCYAHFEDSKGNLPPKDGMDMLNALRQVGFYKVNFAGGEPLMNKHLGAYLQYAKKIGLKTSIITNASLLTVTWLETFGPFIDQIGISCDSLNDTLNKSLGRGYGAHVKITRRALERVQRVNEKFDLNIRVKLNTVVMRQNANENFTNFLLQSGVERWKIFKVLPIEGENDHVYDEISVSESDFQSFVDRHQHLSSTGIAIVPENNEDMTESYLMISPDGRFYQNTNGAYEYSSSIIENGVEKALKEIGFQYSKYCVRGGNYSL